MLILSDNGTRYLSVPSLDPEEQSVGSGASPEVNDGQKFGSFPLPDTRECSSTLLTIHRPAAVTQRH